MNKKNRNGNGMFVNPPFFPVDLRVDARLGSGAIIASPRPELSWRVVARTGTFHQSAYHIRASTPKGELIWDSGIVPSGNSQWIPWGGRDLRSREIVEFRVTVFDASGMESEESEPCHFEIGLVSRSDWGDAHWIYYAGNNYSTSAPSPHFRREFSVRSGLNRARLYVTARGIFEAHLDGRKIGADFLMPGWTDFRKEIPYLAYDLTESLSPGRHLLGAILADGWCCGNLTIFRFRNFYHPHPEFLARLELDYDDGSSEAVTSGSSWGTATGPILSADLYDGENYDARLEMPGWDTCGFDSSKWNSAAAGDPISATPPLILRTAPPVRNTMELEPVRILHPKKDVSIWDFGQNFTGVFRVRLRGNPGRLYTFHVAEMLDTDGSLYTLNYRGARSTDSYICTGPLESFVEYSPRFTFHGFRYLQIDGFQMDRISESELKVTGLVLHSDLETIGSFECGKPLVNRFMQNVLWSQRCNFLEIPTDCPQRDERLGWTGDAQLFAPTAMLNMECDAFYRKYLRDVRDALASDGAAPSIAPAVLRMFDGAAGWGDALILIPYQVFRFYGDTTILRENFNAMERSIEWQKQHSDGLIRLDSSFGDWLAPEPTPRNLVSTAYFALCAARMGEIAAVLHKKAKVEKYQTLASDASVAFRRHFTDSCGVVSPRTQTALVLALAFDLLEEKSILANVVALEECIRGNGTRLSTGFLGTSLIVQTLARFGRTRLACDLLLQEEYPSWLFSVKQGATTLWERWDSFSLENGFGDVTMNSFNHYASGAVAEFLIAGLGGIHYRFDQLRFEVIPDERFSPVHVVLDSPRGRIESDWKISGRKLYWRIQVPPGVPAEAKLPDGQTVSLRGGEHVFTVRVLNSKYTKNL